jgi:transcriptional regulator with XRE-family HTH domain
VAEGSPRPFCHLLLKAVRVDSRPPLEFAILLTEYRTKQQLTQRQLSDLLGVSLKTFQNWERGRTKLLKKFWPTLLNLRQDVRVDSPPGLMVHLSDKFANGNL